MAVRPIREVTRKVIFWDVDGVLNHPKIWGAWTMLGWANSLDPHLVARARDVVRRTGAKCVLSSMWRIGPDGLDNTIAALEKRGWPEAGEDFIDKTEYLPGKARGVEIGTWLLHHPDVEQFVIVDDCNDMWAYMNKLVRTDFNVGLSEEDAEEIVRRLTSV